MTTKKQVALGLLVSVSSMVWFTPAIAKDKKDTGSEKRRIVVFEDGASEEYIKGALAEYEGRGIKKLRGGVKADVVVLSDAQVKKLASKNRVVRIEDDAEVTAEAKGGPSKESIPWNISKVNADKTWIATTGDGIKVAVIDSGINVAHPELINQVKGGYNAITPGASFNDDYGHGTHVAGIIAAEDNSSGIIGTAPNADLYSVKVLGADGKGYVSDIIEAIDWSIANGMQVINMSIVVSVDVVSFHDAVTRAYNAGVVQVAAAGNTGGTVQYPAAYSEVIAVSATDQRDAVTSWSSRGSQVDLAAPGNAINSTYFGSGYTSMSGTSMASPHVAGVVALLLKMQNKCEYLLDANPGCSPAEVQKRLELTARQATGDTVIGKDVLYGSGIVDAFTAVAAN